MLNKVKLLSNIFLIIGVIFGIITLFQIPYIDLLNFRIHWIVFLFLVVMTVLFIVLALTLKCVYKQYDDEIQSIYKYYDKKIKDIENVNQLKED